MCEQYHKLRKTIIYKYVSIIRIVQINEKKHTTKTLIQNIFRCPISNTTTESSNNL